MSIINEEYLNQIKEARESGKYPVASIDLIRNIENITVSQEINDHVEYTEELLQGYLDRIKSLNGFKPGLKEYLETIKAADIIDNQKMEKENSFLIGLYMQVQRKSASEQLINILKTKGKISAKDIVKVHETLLTGTFSELDGTEPLRMENNKFVGRFENGKRKIEYFPIDYKEIPESLSLLANCFNSEMSNLSEKDILLQPIIVHGLLGALQIFEDGNTRMGRIMQHVLIWKLINERRELKFNLPPIYVTRAYYPLRSNYRDKISNLVIYNNDEVWNDWISFNLNRIEDQIFFNHENIKVMERKIGKE